MLYLVGTPIGNLEDITLRALRILKEVDLIAAEDTRQTLKLLNKYEIKNSLMSYHEHNKKEKGAELIEKLKQGQNIALVTDAGMPGISDPGEDLVKLCIENNIEFTVIPGPTAFTTALVMSGLSDESFIFVGFLSAKKNEREAKLNELINEKHTLIFYEAPHKLLKTLESIKKILGNRKIAVCRELTKRFEQSIRGTVEEVISYFNVNEPKGEFVVIVNKAEKEEIIFDVPIYEQIDKLIKEGMDKKSAIMHVSRLRNLPKRVVYNEFENLKSRNQM